MEVASTHTIKYGDQTIHFLFIDYTYNGESHKKFIRTTGKSAIDVIPVNDTVTTTVQLTTFERKELTLVFYNKVSLSDIAPYGVDLLKDLVPKAVLTVDDYIYEQPDDVISDHLEDQTFIAYAVYINTKIVPLKYTINGLIFKLRKLGLPNT